MATIQNEHLTSTNVTLSATNAQLLDTNQRMIAEVEVHKKSDAAFEARVSSLLEEVAWTDEKRAKAVKAAQKEVAEKTQAACAKQAALEMGNAKVSFFFVPVFCGGGGV